MHEPYLPLFAQNAECLRLTQKQLFWPRISTGWENSTNVFTKFFLHLSSSGHLVILALHIFVYLYNCICIYLSFFLFLQFCCVAGYHNLIILRGDRAIYPEKGLLATNYQGKTIFLLTLQRRDRSRDKILISKYCISYLSAYCTEMYRGRAACYWLDI